MIERQTQRQLLARDQGPVVQGGPLDDEQTRAFEAEPFRREALQLRCWDDRAKIPGLNVPPLRHYLPRVAAELQGAGIVT